jgi:putative metal-binding protein
VPRPILLLSICVVVACGPTAGEKCSGPDCASGPCNPGEMRQCYTGTAGTSGVGPCRDGTQTCSSAGQWGSCDGEVTPSQEVCGDGVDNNCNGTVDENVDADGDGWTTCQGDCCDSTECGNPAEVNPGAFDVPGDGVDNDCDGTIDNAQLLCDQSLPSGSTDAMDFAKAIELCQTTTMTDPMKRWGVIDAKLTLADGTGTPNAKSHAILGHYGTSVMPHAGSSLMLISTGNAAGEGDPNFLASLDGRMLTSSGFPTDFYAAHGHALPNAPNCPEPQGSAANDPVMLTVRVRVPSNARSFSLDTNFFSDEFPEFTCSAFNDFFVVLLDSSYSGPDPNPVDKNLAVYTDPQMKKYPVGVNLASGNTGLFTQCMNGHIGCAGGIPTGTITTCTSTAELAGTGMEMASPQICDANSLMGGGTGWLTTTGNVVPGEIITLRIAIWDTSDDHLDSLSVIDNFRWSADPSTPGTVILRAR